MEIKIATAGGEFQLTVGDIFDCCIIHDLQIHLMLN